MDTLKLNPDKSWSSAAVAACPMLTRSVVPTAPCQRTRGVAWSVTKSPHRVTIATFDHVTRGGPFLVAESPSRSKIKLRMSDPSGCVDVQ
ncbi:hypothetical protein PCASD_05394 [Puccinia coronata f. sp. avenae]|uniref:Uncharacterized protein n=1 Tax=Puccinia coronata f. sp. avenae TaxID=200324 RepID=A0A2N5UV18_9BASI|nr:hypothetical protein PCASD_25403 [Puccinia coronata f. sp. avenae]PLW41609.1 hypothetical protein PCASD_05394 [Puccinia coronata f. sp. avenae]